MIPPNSKVFEDGLTVKAENGMVFVYFGLGAMIMEPEDARKLVARLTEALEQCEDKGYGGQYNPGSL